MRPWAALTVQFQPTLPMRGATGHSALVVVRARNFNPRSPCGERQVMRPWAALTVQFQPTLPMRGATVIAFEGEVMSEISTHAPHAGSD